ncbi:hypothetical protein [Cardiobacterium hominis]|jgi:membrane protein|uniref:hypothetical protein n=1 Tax=Cardiobacterium hominis TaxID=2718 RepID=UPI0028D77C1A|nr:hypothetical protein [Cardiobacterium hominis]
MPQYPYRRRRLPARSYYHTQRDAHAIIALLVFILCIVGMVLLAGNKKPMPLLVWIYLSPLLWALYGPRYYLQKSKDWPPDILIFMPRHRRALQCGKILAVLLLLLTLPVTPIIIQEKLATNDSQAIMRVLRDQIFIAIPCLYLLYITRRALRAQYILGYSAAQKVFLLRHGNHWYPPLPVARCNAIFLDEYPDYWQITLCGREEIPAFTASRRNNRNHARIVAIAEYLGVASGLPWQTRRCSASALFLPPGWQWMILAAMVLVPLAIHALYFMAQPLWNPVAYDAAQFYKNLKFLFFFCGAFYYGIWNRLRRYRVLLRYDDRHKIFFRLTLQGWQKLMARHALTEIVLAKDEDGWQALLYGTHKRVLVYQHKNDNRRAEKAARHLAEKLCIASGLPLVKWI